MSIQTFRYKISRLSLIPFWPGINALLLASEMWKRSSQLCNGSLVFNVSFSRHQDSLLEQQRALLTNHRGMHDRIADNLEQLANEKALIHTGQEQLANMTKSIWQQLGRLLAVLMSLMMGLKVISSFSVLYNKLRRGPKLPQLDLTLVMNTL